MSSKSFKPRPLGYWKDGSGKYKLMVIVKNEGMRTTIPDLSFDPASRRGCDLSNSSLTTIGLGGVVGSSSYCGRLLNPGDLPDVTLVKTMALIELPWIGEA
jgi:hypothetical protein